LPKRFAPRSQGLDELVRLEEQCESVRFQRVFAQFRRRISIASLLGDVERLDAALRFCGDSGIGVEELRRVYLPEGPLAPLKRPSSSGNAVRRSLAGRVTERSKSDLRESIQCGRSCLSPLGP
jgi:hypothetical protein